MQAVLCTATSLLLSLLFLQPTHVKIYKWVDENGKTQYGDRPGSENADIIQLKKEALDSKSLYKPADKRQKLLYVLQEEREEKQELKAAQRKKQEEQQQKCATLAAELEDMKNVRYLYEDTDDPFNLRIVSDEERKRTE